MTFDQVRLIHYLRHMHQSRPDKIWMSWRDIGRIMKMSHMTCRYAILKYQKQGLEFHDRRIHNGKTNRKKKITDAARDYLLSQSVLKSWSGLTLAQRC